MLLAIIYSVTGFGIGRGGMVLRRQNRTDLLLGIPAGLALTVLLSASSLKH